jgi:hypothetical protein
LLAAEHAFEVATNNLNRILPTAGALRDEYVDAVARQQSARQAMVPVEILDQWNDYRGRADHLEHVLDSLDVWRRWALGHDLSAARLSESAAVIHGVAANGHVLRLTEITAIVDGWLCQAGLARSPGMTGRQPTRPVLRRGHGLEL